MLILYSLMIPFLVLIGGGNQVREREDELTAVTLSCSGGLLGAITHVQKIIVIMRF